MSMSFSGQVALVTGGAAGIGRATALAFAAEGLKVAVVDLDAAGGESCVEQIRAAGGEARFIRCDVTADAQVRAMVEEVLATVNSGRAPAQMYPAFQSIFNRRADIVLLYPPASIGADRSQDGPSGAIR